MSSIIEGYNYDIFISYRQKDNRGERWVSEFVESLKTELESTFKEEISVYFDINPSDYLLENYDVDASLKEKLKCLVFIPVISRTYCDFKSFAWIHEFKAFIELASKDKYGLKIKLPNGNVANRALPVRIHDLDSADLKEYESVLGGVLRGIEFIYKEAGIDKPLAPNDDEKKNLNGTKYRIQIIKVAHAIKEIILGMKNEPAQAGKGKEQRNQSSKEVREEEKKIVQEKPVKQVKVKFLIPLVVLTLSIVAGIIIYPKIFERDILKRLRASGERVSVAVMPFQNMTGDTTKNILKGWIQDNLINLLSNSEELKVKTTESVNAVITGKGIKATASISPSLAGSISRKLEAKVFVYGNIKRDITTIRLTAQIIDSKTEEIFRNFQIDVPTGKEITNKIIDSLSVMVKDYLEVTKLKQESPDNLQGMLSTVNSPEAYRYFIAGKKAFEQRDFPTVFKNLTTAIEIDSNFTYAPILLAQAYGNVGRYNEGKNLVLRQYEKRDKLSYQMRTYTDWIYAYYFETPNERIIYLKQLLEIDDQSPDYHFLLGSAYASLFQFSNAIPEYEKALEINYKWGSKPWWSGNYTNLGYCYHMTDQYRKEKKIYERAEKDFPDDPSLIARQAILALYESKTNIANENIKKYISVLEESSTSEATIAGNLGVIYSEAGIFDTAEEYYRKALSLEPKSQGRMNNLAYFLIEKDRNVNEGMELVDKVLETYPDNFNYLHTKGWGLFKQGNYREALEILQKSWNIRREKAIYNHEAFLHLESAKKAVAALR